MEYLTIDIWQLYIALLLVVAAGSISVVFQLRLERDLVIGTLRSCVQLVAMGYLLIVIFTLQHWWSVLGIYLLMIFFSVCIIRDRVKQQTVSYFIPTMISTMCSYTLITMLVTKVILQADNWWEPQYFITIGGMIAGNTMSALALAIERLFADLKKQRAAIEMQLCCCASPAEASADIFRQAVRAGMIPSVNAMMGVGLVFLPGMMTGQIIAGVDPVQAVRYQIVVMFMGVAATAFAVVFTLLFIRRRCFGTAMNLLIQ